MRQPFCATSILDVLPGFRSADIGQPQNHQCVTRLPGAIWLLLDACSLGPSATAVVAGSAGPLRQRWWLAAKGLPLSAHANICQDSFLTPSSPWEHDTQLVVRLHLDSSTAAASGHGCEHPHGFRNAESYLPRWITCRNSCAWQAGLPGQGTTRRTWHLQLLIFDCFID